jgi:Domain of unknown function (DUF3943)
LGSRWALEVCGLPRGSRKSCLSSVAFAFALAPSLPVVASPPSIPADDTSLPPAPIRHPVALTLLEEFAALGVQGAWYWGHSRYGSTGADVTAENFFANLISNDFALDEDRFRTNGVGHPLAGAVAYQIARGNGMSVGESFLASFFSTVAWKYFGEWNQVHSINDLVMSPASGWVIGEATYRVGRWFAAGEPGIFNCIGAAALSPTAVLNGSSVCRFRQGDRTPFTIVLPTWHRLAAEIGPSLSTFDGADTRAGAMIGLAALIRANAQYLKPGTGSSTAWAGQWTSVRTRLLVEGGALKGSALDADALVVGRYVRRYAETDGVSSVTDGWSALIGLSSSFDLQARQLPIGWDRTASAGILGPAIELTARHGPLQLRGWFAATYAFSQVTSLAYAQAAPSFAGVTLKRVLQTEGYYFAQGPLSSAVIEGEVGGVRIGLEGRMATFWSIDHGYSNQSEIENNFSLRDTRLFTRAIVSVRLLGGPLRLALEFDDDLRDSRIPGTAVRSNERRFLASVALASR